MPRFLADALEIGPTLCLLDSMSPGVCRHPSGRYCVVMPMRRMVPETETTAAPPPPMTAPPPPQSVHQAA